MRYNIQLSPNFKKEAKTLTRKYPSLKKELSDLFNELEENPTMGISLGNNIYKIKLAIASKGKGKSGGARILTYVKVIETTVLLFTIYNKGDRNNITDSEIKELLAGYK
jgi:mRNA-degrading endonuclease RelE of RelBE toxin-antitoxin system